MSLSKFWAFLVFVVIWFVVMADYFRGLPAGGLLDLAVTEAQVRSALAALQAGEQDFRAYHAWGTGRLDMLAPAILGAFVLVGLRRYVIHTFFFVFGALAVAYVGVDYWENMLSLRLLGPEAAEADMVWNARASLMKYLLLAPPLIVVLLGVVRETVKAFRLRRATLRQGR
jgi:hypothetical protein